MSPHISLFSDHKDLFHKLLAPLAVLAATLTALVATTVAPSAASAATDNFPRLADHLVQNINSIRAREQMPPLKIDPRLSAAALPHAQLMARHQSYRQHYRGEAQMTPQLVTRNYYPRNLTKALASGRNRHAVLTRPAFRRSTTWSSVFQKSMNTVGVGIVWHKHRFWVTVVVAEQGQPSPAELGSSYAQNLLQMLNDERKANGLPALTMNADLIKSAHGHNLNMAAANEMSHQLPGEPYFADRIQNAGYKYWYAGENIGWNSVQTLDGVRQLETIMYNEKAPDNGHRLNILSKNYTNVGIDVYFDNANGKVWLTEDFGKPAYW